MGPPPPRRRPPHLLQPAAVGGCRHRAAQRGESWLCMGCVWCGGDRGWGVECGVEGMQQSSAPLVFTVYLATPKQGRGSSGHALLLICTAKNCSAAPSLLHTLLPQLHVHLSSTCMCTHVDPSSPFRSWRQMGETPLIRSAHNGHFQTVKFLVEKGADVNAVDSVSRNVFVVEHGAIKWWCCVEGGG